MSERQRTPISEPPARPLIQVASAVVRLSAVYLAILTALFAAFRWSLFLVPGIVIAGALAWYSVRLARDPL